jgi:cytochrome c556
MTGKKAFIAVCLLCAGTVGAQDAQQVIEARMAGFRDIGSAFKNIGDQLKASQPNVTKIQASVSAIGNYQGAIANWFPAGSEPPPPEPKSWFQWVSDWFSSGSDSQPDVHESRAKPEIWRQPERFKEAYRQFDADVAEMARASRTGNVAVIRTQFRKLGATCRNCHDVFRNKTD